MKPAALAALPLLALAACGGPPGPNDGGGDAGACRADAGAPPSCASPAPGGRLFVVTSDYASAALEVVGPGATCASREFMFVTGDTVLGWHARELVAMQFDALGEDSVTFFDVGAAPYAYRTASSRLPGETRSANARAYLPAGSGRGYIALFNRGAIAVVDTTAPAVIAGIDLAGFASNGSLPYPTSLAMVAGRAWAAIDRLPAGLTNPTEPGVIAVIDPATDSVMGSIELPRANPQGAMAVRPNGEVWVACPGAYQRVDDGAVVALDGAAMRVARELVTEQDVGGNIDAVLPLGESRMVLRVAARATGDALAVSDTRLVEWDAATRVARTWLTVPEYALTAPVLGSDGRVYVGDRGDEASCRRASVRVFDAATGSEIGAAAIATGLPPYDLLTEPALR